MKKVIIAIIIFIIVVILICELTPLSEIINEYFYNNYVSDNGWLYVEGTSLKNQRFCYIKSWV